MEEVIIITGAGSGMGKAMVNALADMGIKLIMASRNMSKLEKIREEVLRIHPRADIELIPVDLASFVSVDTFVGEMLRRGYRINTLINNAGVLPEAFRLTQSGFESAIGTNYIGVYYLNRQLLAQEGLMTAGSLILNTISISYKIGHLNESVFSTQPPKGLFHRINRYANSKLALLVYTLALAELLKSREVRVLAVDPGIVSTGMIAMHQWYDFLTDIFFRPFIKTAEQGADTAVYLTKEAQKGSALTGKCIRHRKEMKLSSKTRGVDRQEWLIRYTEQLLQAHLSE